MKYVRSALAILLITVVGTLNIGCRSTRHSSVAARSKPVASASHSVSPASYEQPQAKKGVDDDPAVDVSQPELIPLGQPLPMPDLSLLPPTLDDVVTSVRMHFPLIREAEAGRTIAAGEALEAAGAFDRKLDLFSESQPLDFYKNYRNGFELKRDTLWGGQTFAGYRIGRGGFEPWYLERETNGGGEFNVGFRAPVVRDRDIDANRSQLWQSQLERGRVEPVVRAQVIQSVRDGAVAYWDWVAAAAAWHLAEGVLKLAEDRAGFLTRQVELGEKARIDLVDNRRIIVSRQAKLTDARRKLDQASYKLSLFLRTDVGAPLVPGADAATGEFPETNDIDQIVDSADIALAIANRPELVEVQVVRRQLAIALRQANNETLPDVDAGMYVSQDVGEPTSPKRDKSQLKLEAMLTLSVPLERRKALGKVRQLRGKLAQVRAKLQFAEEKIATQVQVARAALVAAAQRVGQTSEGVKLAERMQSAENRLYDEGQSTLLNLNLRELQAAEAAAELIDARREYFIALAEYQAALGMDGDPTAATIEDEVLAE